MSDLEPTRTERTVVLAVDVSTDQELATVHATLSRMAAGYICDGMDSRVYVHEDEDDDGALSSSARPTPATKATPSDPPAAAPLATTRPRPVPRIPDPRGHPCSSRSTTSSPTPRSTGTWPTPFWMVTSAAPRPGSCGPWPAPTAKQPCPTEW